MVLIAKSPIDNIDRIFRKLQFSGDFISINILTKHTLFSISWNFGSSDAYLDMNGIVADQNTKVLANTNIALELFFSNPEQMCFIIAIIWFIWGKFHLIGETYIWNCEKSTWKKINFKSLNNINIFRSVHCVQYTIQNYNKWSFWIPQQCVKWIWLSLLNIL